MVSCKEHITFLAHLIVLNNIQMSLFTTARIPYKSYQFAKFSFSLKFLRLLFV